MTKQSNTERVCHFCGLVIEDDEKVIEAETRNGWAHITCWYDGGPFERKMRGLLRRREDRRAITAPTTRRTHGQ